MMRYSHLGALLRDGAPTIINKDDVRLNHFRPRGRKLIEQCGCRDTLSGKVCVAWKKHFDVTKIDPEQVRLPGSASLLPQLVGSFVRAAVSGDGVPPGWAQLDQPSGEISQPCLRITSHRPELSISQLAVPT